MTSTCLSFYRQSSSRFRIQYTILTFCRCCVTIPFYFYILLRFLISEFIFIKRGIEDITQDSQIDVDKEKKEKIEQKEAKEEELDDLADLEEKINDLNNKGVGDRLEKGLPVKPSDYKTYEKIKEEFSSYFDKESGKTPKIGLNEVQEYLQDEKETILEGMASLNLNEKVLKKQKVDDSDRLDKENEEKKNKSSSSSSSSSTNKLDEEDKSSSSNKNLSPETSNPNPNKETPTEYVESLSQTEMPSYIDPED